ncbi:competence type IV pilus minor pilin ComGF [Bacillus sp. FJAT-42315]|uniref:competence type IV pilus minor pilin ComGF n=1 Tax=Bacillus sp. FJAT-42315 TaxID=2014077 RepID=UPI0018E21B15|nr:competence type IV pilus minor pilin ComGF [Bacillus sp. FJAT-42315]
MWKCLGRDFVFSSNKGFTLVESLLILMVFMMLAALFPMIYGTVYHVNEQLEPGRKSEWELFVIQLRKEMYNAQSWTPANDKLFYHQAGQKISIEQYQQSVRRRINGMGHEIMLKEVESIQFYWANETLCAKVVFTNGEEEQAQFYSLLEEPL